MDSYAAYALSAAAVSIVTFCGIYHITRSISDAIAASFVLLYFVIASYLLPLPGVRGSLTGVTDGTLTESARDLINNITTFVTVIIGTYFLAEAVERGVARVSRGFPRLQAMLPLALLRILGHPRPLSCCAKTVAMRRRLVAPMMAASRAMLVYKQAATRAATPPHHTGQTPTVADM
jgi:hypothetical protein